MKTESIITETDVERVGKVSLVRSVDLDAIAKTAGEDGKIDAAALATAGEFVVIITPSKRGAEPTRTKVANEAEGAAFIRGFQTAVDMKKKAPRKPKSDAKTAKPPKGAKGK